MYAGQSILTMGCVGFYLAGLPMSSWRSGRPTPFGGLLLEGEDWIIWWRRWEGHISAIYSDGWNADLLQIARLQLARLTPGGCWWLSPAQRQLVPNELNLIGDHVWYNTFYLWELGTEQQSKFQSTRKTRGPTLVDGRATSSPLSCSWQQNYFDTSLTSGSYS